MKTRIATSIGLTQLLAIGLIATMLALGIFLASKAHADVDVTNITLSKTTPGASTQITLNFRHVTDLIAGSGQIIITFDKTWGIPATISKEHVILTSQTTGGGTSNPSIEPSVVAGANSTKVTITIGDTNPATAGNQNLRAQGTPAQSDHILVFSLLAGVTNPTAAAVVTTTTGGAAVSWICVTTSAEATPEAPVSGACPTTGSYTATYTSAVSIPRAVSLSVTSGTNGTEVTATGRGYVTGTLTAFIDHGTNDGHTTAANGHTAASHAALSLTGQFDSGVDSEIGTSTAAVSGGTGTVIFTIRLPQFATGTNNINLMDGLGNADATPAVFTMIGSVTTSKSSVKRGESVVVKLRQFGAGTVTAITFGGAGASLTGQTLVIPASGTLDITVTVPTTTPLGTQRVSVVSTGETTRNVNIEVVGAPLVLSPTTAVSGQKITISGSGFTTGGAATVAANSITVGGTVNPATPSTHALVTIDSGGNLVVAYTVPNTATTRTAGSYTVLVTDSSGRTGQATLTIPPRTLSLDPTVSGRGSTVAFSGGGFPSKATVRVDYGATLGVASATADSAGIFSGTFTVPTSAGIPSTSTVTATATSTGNNESKTATHKIPGASLTVNPVSGAAGTAATVAGSNFPAFLPLSSLTFSGIDVRPSPAPATNAQGSFTAEFDVPALPLGFHVVLATAGGITANAIFEIALAPPDIEVSPWSFDVAAPQGGAITELLRVRNTGDNPLEFSIAVVDTTPPAGSGPIASSAQPPSGWGDLPAELERNRSQRMNNAQQVVPILQGAPVINLRTIIVDPEGDAAGDPPVVDIVRVDGGIDAASLTLGIFFSEDTAMDQVVGFIHLDTDQDPSTGFPPTARFGLPEQNIGADFFLNLFNLRDTGVISLFDADAEFIADVATKVGARSIEITMPLSALGGDDGNVDVTMVLGNSSTPTDWAPGTGHGTVGPLVWLTLDPPSGNIPGGSSDLLEVNFDAADLAPGTYTAEIIFTTNDPDENPVILPVIFAVEASGLVVVKPVAPDVARPGSEFDLEIQASDVQNLAGAELVLRYDSSMLTVVGTQRGSDFEGCSGTESGDTPGELRLVLACIGGHSGAPLTLWTVRLIAASVTDTIITQLTVADVVLGDAQVPPQEIPAVGSSSMVSVILGICGDLDDDGDLDVLDSIIFLQIVAGAVTPTQAQLILGDVVRDRSINVLDLILVLQHIVGLTQITECGPLEFPLVVGSATAAPGEEVTLAVTLDSLGTTVRLIQVNLAFDGLTLTNPTGSGGDELPPEWHFASFSPEPGGLNFLAVDLDGIGEALDGPMFSATFTVDATVPDWAVPVSVEFADVRGDANRRLNLVTSSGVVTVTIA